MQHESDEDDHQEISRPKVAALASPYEPERYPVLRPILTDRDRGTVLRGSIIYLGLFAAPALTSVALS